MLTKEHNFGFVIIVHQYIKEYLQADKTFSGLDNFESKF